MNYIFIGAHPDDIEIHCNGALARLTREGNRAHFVYLYYTDIGHKASLDAAQLLGCTVENMRLRPFHNDQSIVDKLDVMFNGIIKDSTIVTHSESQHPDHIFAREVGYQLSRYAAGLLEWEEWNSTIRNNASGGSLLVQFTENDLKLSFEAIDKYRLLLDCNFNFDTEEWSPKPFPKFDMIKSLITYRTAGYGLQVGAPFAAKFNIIKYIC